VGPHPWKIRGFDVLPGEEAQMFQKDKEDGLGDRKNKRTLRKKKKVGTHRHWGGKSANKRGDWEVRE